MKLKTKLVSALTMFCLTIAMLFVGVWAASSADVTLGGTISFKSKNVYASIEATIEGAVGATNPTPLTFSAETPNPDKTSWTQNLTFDENGSMITIKIKITNLATDRPLYASVTDNYGVVTNLDKTISEGANALTLEASNDGDTDTAEVTITLKVNNPDNSLDGASYGYFVDLSSEEPEPIIDASLLTYSINDDGTSVTVTGLSDKNAKGRLIIPSQINIEGTQYSVTALYASHAFEDCVNLTSVVVPGTITWSSNATFEGCTSLETVVFEEGMLRLDSSIFSECTKLSKVCIPKSVTSIIEGTFYSGAAPSLQDIYYAGTEEDWAKITVGEDGNDLLSSATIHYNESF